MFKRIANKFDLKRREKILPKLFLYIEFPE